MPPGCEPRQWQAAAHEEAEGGVSVEIRVFLDSQLSTADVLVDLAPGLCFVALSAATAASGTPAVLVSGISADHLRGLQDAAIDVGTWVDEIPMDARPEMAALIETRLGVDGNVCVHLDSATTASACEWLRPLLAAGRVLAICVSDAATSSDWSVANAALAAIDFQPFVLQEHDGNLMMTPVSEAPPSAVIALPASVAQDDGRN